MHKSLVIKLINLVNALGQQQVIAYPTEAVFGLGCDPDSETAVRTLLRLKQRPWQKGLILIAAYYAQLTDYIDDQALDNATRERMFSCWPGFVTWVVPASDTTPLWLTGQYTSLAIRVSAFEPVRRLCLAFGKPLVSTSANLAGLPAARTSAEVRKQLGNDILMLDEAVEGHRNPSKLLDALTGASIR
ncbi:Sua5/YciO/YrdC/YwlC family protein [Sodalis endosymbiont of Henestaris halophilus]|uniref:Sua5/YciO/YrdC/YwlC family protein n=1 Tax=Sodalis endosymbiont of Henestaris halophilus TaxID=1929246 RepID=UPI000BBF7AEE|nr:Sua5/YciO/YrdC/YwlC family protein [Sodalis endosymbiont of Henestaris halophilus]SNC58456.1 Threonylcarbamoyl-AMP synthase [Sodalis endosymbiont of Henestaris halophilus]